ncbi:MAG: ABC transporter ATP-binding protein [Candidatus Caldarchaeum sp.]|nr:ABC transporter ATP-binding protein [Candidatus Caldarchaeum sp.]MDW8062717.1 ABC transporter ATP-binding protein [Candidatus Caldarchaeum sp.]
MATYLVEVNDLWKSFGKIRAVRGISFRLEPGQIHGLLGPNGSGKTTTLRCIVGLLRPDRGTVKIAGEEISKTDSYKRTVGYLPENPSLPEYLTVEEFLIFSAKLKGLDAERVRRDVSHLMDAFGLVDVSDRLIYELSKGVRQRVAVSASLVGEPPILIMDEPFNGLDPEAQKTTKDFINITVERGGAVLISTHLLDSAEKICNYASVIAEGTLLQSSPLYELKRYNGGKSLEEIFIEMVSRRRMRKIDS